MAERLDDEALQSEVLAALRRASSIPAAHIGVSASSGAVTLSGDVDTTYERFAAVEVAQSVEGVLAVADELHVRNGAPQQRTDTDIAIETGQVLSAVAPSHGHIYADVVDHVVFLSGEVASHRDRETAERAASSVAGVRNVINQITIGPPPSLEDVERQIHSAFVAQARERARGVAVTLDGGEVLLKGSVATLADKILAERAAYETPGVHKVRNHLHVG